EAPPEKQLTQSQKESYRLPESQKALGIERLKLLTLIQMTFPGVPSIYYGDEAGLEGYSDPLNRRTYPWGGENRELLKWYKAITSIRNKYDVFSTGRWIPIYSEGDVYGYVRSMEKGRDVFGRQCEDNTALVLVNRSRDFRYPLSLDLSQWHRGVIYDLLEGGKAAELREGMLDVTLEPLQGKVFIAKLRIQED
ncbi:MAG TPA: alpha-amylase family glycosyl hydrolase, partial [Bacillota bacterium]|nr:alpha-amylase family glycosyl hydrolase [Bacillota bacterium]